MADDRHAPPNYFWRWLATFVLIVLLILLPLPRHWPLLPRIYPDVFDELTSLNLYLADVAGLALLATAVPLYRRSPSLPGPKILTAPMAALVVMTIVSGVFAAEPALVWQHALRLFVLLAIGLVLMWLKLKPDWVQAGLAVSLTLQAAAALLQFGAQDDLGLRWLGELDLGRHPGGGSILASGGGYWLRGYGLTPHPNILGGVLVVFLLILVASFLQARPRARIGWLGVILLGGAGLFVSFSRSAWLGGAVGGLVWLGGLLLRREWRGRYGRSLFILAVSLGLLLAGLGWTQRHLLLSRFSPARNEFETRSVAERTALIEAGQRLRRSSPWTGIGAGNTAVAIAPLVQDLPAVGPQPVHNVPLLLAIELGWPGAILWAWLMLAPVGLALYRCRQGRLTLWALGLTAALAAFAIIDLLDYYAWGWPQGALLRWLCWGLWGAAVVSGR